MSKKAMDWAWSADIGDWAKKFVLVTLAWHADDEGITSEAQEPPAMPGYDALAWAFDQQAPNGRDKFVLVALAYRCAPSDHCVIDLAELKAMTSMPAMGISESVRRLAVRKLIHVEAGVAHMMRGYAA